jgi:hypothetical protein
VLVRISSIIRDVLVCFEIAKYNRRKNIGLLYHYASLQLLL